MSTIPKSKEDNCDYKPMRPIHDPFTNPLVQSNDLHIDRAALVEIIHSTGRRVDVGSVNQVDVAVVVRAETPAV